MKISRAWVYFSVVDDLDNGNIVNFVKNRTGQEFGEIAKELMSWLGEGSQEIQPQSYVRNVEEKEFDIERVKSLFKSCYPIQYHSYLQSRGITQALLNSPRFKNRVYFDKYKKTELKS